MIGKSFLNETVRNGLAGAAVLIFLLHFFQFGALARRAYGRSDLYPVALGDHGNLFHVSNAENFALILMLGLSALFFVLTMVIDSQLRTSKKPKEYT
ncbi:MAG: hypothetical protein DCF29_14310 [Alphaproteobacteria bacterium]|nr:MAG: hypothetical protein DCF29_14310 [Alphaproteobacteria bacterium]